MTTQEPLAGVPQPLSAPLPFHLRRRPVFHRIAGASALYFLFSASATAATAANCQGAQNSGSSTGISVNLTTSAGACADGPVATAIGSVAIGAQAQAVPLNAVAVGAQATSAGEASVAVGAGASTGPNGRGDLAFGENARANGGGASASAVAVGSNSFAAAGTVAVGGYANASGVRASALGDQSVAAGARSLAAGESSRATADGSVALGSMAQANAASGIALGQSANVGGAAGLAIGTRAAAMGNAGAIALGSDSNAGADGAIAAGNRAQATGAYAVAIGSNAMATQAGSVVLGRNSQDRAAAQVAGGTVGGVNYAYAGTASGVASIGAAGAERQLIHLAPGSVSAASTDAVNGSQLYAAQQAIDSVKASTDAGWRLSVNSADDRKVSAGDTVDVSQGSNISVERTANGLRVSTARDVNFDSVTVGTNVLSATGLQMGSAVNLGPQGLVIVGGPSVTASGIDAGGAAIANVGNGVKATDAVNLGQLQAAVQGVNTERWVSGSATQYAAPTATGADALAAGSGAQASGDQSTALGAGAKATEANSVALGNGSTTRAATSTAGTVLDGTQYSFAGGTAAGVVSVGQVGGERQIQNVAAGRLSADSTDAVNGSQLYATNDAIGALVARLAATEASRTHYVGVNDGGAPGGNYNNDGATGLLSTAIGVNAASAGASSVALGAGATSGAGQSVAIGGAAVVSATGGVALGAGAVADRAGMNGASEAFSGVRVASTAGAVSVGSAGAERQITNVAGGTADTDAVNVRQLRSVQQSSVAYATRADGSTDYSSVVLGNGQAPQGTVISNVAPGVKGTDAVNLNQLQAGVASANAYTDAVAGSLKQNIDQVARKASAGTAAAMSMETAPYLAGKVTYGAGMGYYGGQSAFGMSLRSTSGDGRWSVNGGVSADTQGSVGIRVGLSGAFE